MPQASQGIAQTADKTEQPVQRIATTVRGGGTRSSMEMERPYAPGRWPPGLCRTGQFSDYWPCNRRQYRN